MLQFLLLLMLFQPLLGAGLIWIWRKGQRTRQIALFSTLLSLLCAVILALCFDPSGAAIELSWSWLGRWVEAVDIRLHLSIDGISLWLIVLTALLSLTAVQVSWQSVGPEVWGFYALLLLLETGMLGVFLAQDIILFYIFFEFTLIPLYFLIGIWGSPGARQWAALKFFIYTLAGSVITFLGLIYVVIGLSGGVLTFSIPELIGRAASHPFSITEQWWLFLALLAGFAIKVPLFPFHTWLPLAHTEAPTAGSVLLAGVLLKIGTYGFLRFTLPLLPQASVHFLSLVALLAVIGIVYGALAALAQADIKRLVAYSSVSHMGLCMLGLFSLNQIGITGGLLQTINHGLSTGALFALVGMLYERYHTREIIAFGGLARKLPILCFFFVVITLSSIGLPGLNGFVGEFLVLVGALQASTTFSLSRIYVVTAATAIILGAFYMLWLVQRVFFGQLREPGDERHEVRDLSRREILTLAPIAALCLWIGIYPNFFISRMQGDVQKVAAIYADGAETELAAKPEMPLEFGTAREDTPVPLENGTAPRPADRPVNLSSTVSRLRR